MIFLDGSFSSFEEGEWNGEYRVGDTSRTEYHDDFMVHGRNTQIRDDDDDDNVVIVSSSSMRRIGVHSTACRMTRIILYTGSKEKQSRI